MAQTSEPTTYRIPDPNWPKFRADLAKLAKRAAKLGVPAPAYEEVDTEMIPVVGPGGATGELRLVHHVTVTGEAPRFDGWTMIAVIDLDPHGTSDVHVVHTIGDTVKDPAWHTLGERCDHCHVDNRGRRLLVVVEHEQDGRKVVGSTCLRDFLGHKSPQAIASWAEMLADFDPASYEDIDEGGAGGWTDPNFVNPVEYLCWVVRCIDAEGWTPRSAARYQGRATADSALDAMFGRGPADREFRQENPTTDADREEAEAALAWARSLELGRNDYLDNVRAVAGSDAWKQKDLGLGASIISAHRRHLDREITRKATAATHAESQHVGQESVRQEFGPLTVTFTLPREGDYGTRELVKFLDADGNVITWWSSKVTDLTAGDVVTGKATVKRHEVYQGVAQTLITRAKFEIVPALEEQEVEPAAR